MSQASGPSQTSATSKSTATGTSPVMTRTPERRGMAQLQRTAGNRLVAALFDGPPPSQDPLEYEAERQSREVRDSARMAAANGSNGVQHHSGGAPLETSAKSSMEKKFRADFSEVRVHEDAGAQEMSESIGAKAFTLGDDVFFNSGMGPSSGAAGHVLLAHELAHVLQQRQRGAVRIQRAPKDQTSGGNVKPASTDDKRDFIRETIRALHDMADYYKDLVRIAQVSKTKPKVSAKNILPKWKTTLEFDLKLLDEKTDAKLLNDLKSAYRNMVEALVTADSASQSTETLRETFEKYRSDIHESGWLLGVAEPTANQLSDQIPEAERAKIKVITTTAVTEAMLSLGNAFSSTAKTSPPSGVTMVFSGTIPAKLQPGFNDIGKSLVQTLSPPPLPLNSTIALALDLSKFGGDYALYRFTFFQHTETKDKKKVSQKQLLVERLGTVGMEGLRESDAAWKKFRDHKFKFAGMWRTAEKEAVISATQLIPDSQLSLVDGITFKRDSVSPDNPKDAGHYEVESHTIVIFDLAFAESAVRFGVPGATLATPATYDVAHEIGHAIDRRKYRAALETKATAAASLRAKFGKYETKGPDDSSTFNLPNDIPKDVSDEFNKLMGAATAADAATTKVITESGERFQGKDFKDDLTKQSDFRKAGAGTRISPYADQKWREYFAESFAMYTSDPTTLQRLRPKLFDYFTKNYPKGTP